MLREALRTLRSELGLTQSELAQQLHLNFSTVNRWENNKAVPNSSTAAYMLKFAEERRVSEDCRRMLKYALENRLCSSLDINSSEADGFDAVRSLVDDAASGVYVSDIETNELLYVNRKLEEYIGSKFASNSGIKCYEYILHGSAQCKFCPKNTFSKDSFTEELFVSPITGRIYSVRARLIDWNGRRAHVQYIHDDTASVNSQGGMKSLMNNVPVGISMGYVFDDGRIELSYLNDGYYALLGTKRENRIKYSGFSVLNAVYEEDREPLRSKIMDACSKHSSISAVFRIMLDDGVGTKWIAMNCNIVEQSNGRTTFYCAFSDADAIMKDR